MRKTKPRDHLPGNECSVATNCRQKSFAFSGAHVFRKKRKLRLTLNHHRSLLCSTDVLSKLMIVLMLASTTTPDSPQSLSFPDIDNLISTPTTRTEKSLWMCTWTTFLRSWNLSGLYKGKGLYSNFMYWYWLFTASLKLKSPYPHSNFDPCDGVARNLIWMSCYWKLLQLRTY
jgi:hypothetical protein